MRRLVEMGHRFDDGDWLWMAFGMAATWLVLIAAAIWVLGLLGVGLPRPTERSERDRNRRAQELLDERLARGEMELEDYQARRRALGDDR